VNGCSHLSHASAVNLGQRHIVKYTETVGIFVSAPVKIIAEVAWECYRIRLTLSAFLFPVGKKKY